jgi:hypothetical protein
MQQKYLEDQLQQESNDVHSLAVPWKPATYTVKEEEVLNLNVK